MKLTPKQEQFVKSYIEEDNASAAYRAAYNTDNMKPETINERASRLLKEYKVSTRVAELQSEHRERHNVTVDSLTQEYEDTRAAAFTEKQYASCNTATTGKAKLHGYGADKPISDLHITIELVSFKEE